MIASKARFVSIVLIIVAVLFVATACNSQGQSSLEADQMPTSTITPTATQTSTPTPTFTSTLPPTNTATPDLPVGLGTPLPGELPVIEPDNVSQLVPIAAFGEGAILEAALSQDGSQITVLLTSGFVVYDVETLDKIANIPLSISQDQNYPYALSASGDYIAFFTQDAAQIWNVNQQLLVTEILIEEKFYQAALEFSPTGNSLLVSYGQNDHLISLPSGEIIWQEAAKDAAFSPDGSTLAVGDGSKSYVALLDTTTGAESSRLNGRRSFSEAAFSPDGRYIATAYEKDTWLWDAASGKKLYELYGETGSGLSFSADSQYLFISSNKPATMRVWRASDGELLATLLNQHSPVISPDGLRLVTQKSKIVNGQWVKKVFLWDLETRIPLMESDGSYQQAFFALDNTKVFIQGPARGLTVYQSHDGAELIRVAEGSMFLLPDGQTLISRDNFANIHFRSLTDGSDLGSPQDSINFTKISSMPDGKKFLTWDGSERSKAQLQLWDATLGKLLATIQLPQSASGILADNLRNQDELFASWQPGITEDFPEFTMNVVLPDFPIKFTPDGQLRYFFPQGGMMSFYRANANGEFSSEDEFIVYSIPINNFLPINIIFSSDGQYLAAPRDGILGIWRVSDGEQISQFSVNGFISDLLFSPDNNRILVGYSARNSSYENLQIWDLKTGNIVKTFTYSTGACPFFPFLLSPDSKVLVMRGEKCDLQALALDNSWQGLYTLDVGIGSHGRLAFSPDGKLIVTAFQGGEIKFWDAANGELLFTLVDHENYVMNEPTVRFAFSEDGKIFGISRGQSGAVLTLWGIWP